MMWEKKRIVAVLKLVIAIGASMTFSGCGAPAGGGDANDETGAGNWSPAPGQSGELDPSYRPRGLASKTFRSGSRSFAPMDMTDQNLTMTLDAKAKTVSGRAIITFRQSSTSHPLFLLDAAVSEIRLDGVKVSFGRVTDPDRQNSFVMIDRELERGRTYVAEVEYSLPSDRVSFTNGGVGFLTDMADLLSRFFDKWGPSGFEDDQFALSLRFVLKNSNGTHRVFANGEVSHPAANEWVIKYPAHYNSSSFFAHLTNKALVVNRFVYPGTERAIPITVYSSDSGAVASASNALPRLFKELETDYGPYMHPGFIVYLNNYDGGIEFAGATITQLRSLSHELFHSWFARGVMPAEGRAGWVDEAIASWRDNGYARASSLLGRSPTNLGDFSVYRRATPANSYADGRALLGEFDRLFASRGGMKPILRGLYAKYKGKVITTAEFRGYLEEATRMDLSAYFNRYAYDGRAMPYSIDENARPMAGIGRGDEDDVRDEGGGFEDSFHPPPLTEEELRELR